MNPERLKNDGVKTSPVDDGLASKFRHAYDGFFQALRSERNLRIHCIIAVVALSLCFVLHVPAWGWVAVILCIGAVIAAELGNTALETIVDLVHPDYHELAKRAKDIAAAFVLVLAFISVAVGLIVYITSFIELVG